MPTKTKKSSKRKSSEPEELHQDLKVYEVELEHTRTWIKHPLVFSMMHHSALNKQINDTYKARLKYVAHLEDEGRWPEAVFVHERPYRFEAFERMRDFMTDEEYWETLAEVWMDSENIWQNQEGWEGLLSSERPNRQSIMEAGERTFLSLLHPVVTVFRGYYHDGRADGLSWTHDLGRAAFFARYMRTPDSGEPRVVQGRVRRQDIIAIFDGRNENEVVVADPSVVFDREEIEVAATVDSV